MPIQFLELGVVPYREARDFQNSLVSLRQRSLISDAVLLLEHPPTLTLGQRFDASSLPLSMEQWSRRGIQVVTTDRGGEATLHNPGQLVIYPVFDLRARKLGVRRFVELGLRAISDAAHDCGANAEPRLEPAGVWCGSRKFASVGLRISAGVTNHGFAVNVVNDLEPFSWFNPCGLSGGNTTSLAACIAPSEITLQRFKEVFVSCLLRVLPQ